MSITQTYDAVGRVVSTTNNLGHMTTLTYDDLDRLVSMTDAEGNETIYEYDVLGHQVAITDANGVRTSYEYDTADRLIRVIENDTGGAQTNDSNLVTRYDYDAMGNQVRIVNARNLTSTTTLYDALNRPIMITDALTRTMYIAYNSLGLRTVMTDANGAVTTYEYDGLNRLAAIDYETDNEAVAYAYNALSNRILMTDSLGVTSYTYDDLSRLITVTNPFTGTVVYAYDNAGNRTNLTYPDGKVVTYTYDMDNRLTQVDDWGEGATTYGYDAAGRLITTTLPNDVETVNVYDDANRLIRLTHTNTVSDELVAEYTYELDGLGNRLVTTETTRLPASGGVQTTTIAYNYDPLYRLTGAVFTDAITATYTYVYDTVGNMSAYTETVGAETSSVNRAFDDANQLLTSTDTEEGTSSFYYDDNGNLVEIMPPGASEQDPAGIIRYGYDQRNLLITNTTYISGTGWTTVAEFSYDGDGNRMQQVDYTGASPITTTYHNDNLGLSQVLISDDGSVQTAMLYGHDLIHQDNGTETRTLLADGLGSARTEMVGGAIETVTTYEPYGEVLAQTGESGTVYGYTGERFDAATDLVYLRARYYNPGLQTFMGKDPWSGNNARPQSMNGWSYVDNNPINLVDVTGRSPNLPEPMFPEFCKSSKDKVNYVLCVAKAYGIEPDRGRLFFYSGVHTSFDKEFDAQMNNIGGGPYCYWGPVPYRAPGYAEGIGVQASLLLIPPYFLIGGDEIVYDFAKLESGQFSYEGRYLTDNLLGWSFSEYTTAIEGFSTWRGSIVDDYGGWSFVSILGAGPNLFIDTGFSAGYVSSESLSDRHVQGLSFYVGVSPPSLDIYPVFDTGYALVKYKLSGSIQSYVLEGEKVNLGLLVRNIEQGNASPWTSTALRRFSQYTKADREDAIMWAVRYGWIYESMHLASGP